MTVQPPTAPQIPATAPASAPTAAPFVPGATATSPQGQFLRECGAEEVRNT